MSDRREKQRAELAALEAEFRAQLVAQLRACAVHGTNLFNVSSLLPDSVERCLRSPIADELFTRAERILELSDDVGLSTVSNAAARFCQECRRHSVLSDEQRLGPRRRAQLLLAELAVDDDGRPSA